MVKGLVHAVEECIELIAWRPRTVWVWVLYWSEVSKADERNHPPKWISIYFCSFIVFPLILIDGIAAIHPSLRSSLLNIFPLLIQTVCYKACSGWRVTLAQFDFILYAGENQWANKTKKTKKRREENIRTWNEIFSDFQSLWKGWARRRVEKRNWNSKENHIKKLRLKGKRVGDEQWTKKCFFRSGPISLLHFLWVHSGPIVFLFYFSLRPFDGRRVKPFFSLSLSTFLSGFVVCWDDFNRKWIFFSSRFLLFAVFGFPFLIDALLRVVVNVVIASISIFLIFGFTTS